MFFTWETTMDQRERERGGKGSFAASVGAQVMLHTYCIVISSLHERKIYLISDDQINLLCKLLFLKLSSVISIMHKFVYNCTTVFIFIYFFK